MIISDLNHLNSVLSSTEIVGGSRHHKPGKVSIIKNKVVQKVDAYAVAVNLGKKGDATAYNYTEQSVSINN